MSILYRFFQPILLLIIVVLILFLKVSCVLLKLWVFPRENFLYQGLVYREVLKRRKKVVTHGRHKG